MSNQYVYKLGTRKSLLAKTQSTLIKQEIEKKTGIQCELVLIETQGDQQTDKPLWQMEGKDFFTKELDAALLANEIDFVVSSYKDLGSERPDGITLGAITERLFTHDILLIKEKNIEKIKTQKEIIIGTSSPRRMANSKYLNDFFPGEQKGRIINCDVLRGNVNTRIEKLLDDKYDAVILALAGLERLARMEESKNVLKTLLNGLTFFILPRTVFPSSASQGALALEYNANGPRGKEMKEILGSVHHDITAQEMQRERKAFLSYGGGCHLAVGIEVKKQGEHFLHIHRGEYGEKIIYTKELENIEVPKKEAIYFVKGEHDFLLEKKTLPNALPAEKSHLFITGQNCFSLLEESASKHLLWASGTATAKKLVQKGFWIQGSADALGHEEIIDLQRSQALRIMSGENTPWFVLSHDQATSEVGSVIAAYTREVRENDSQEYKNQLLAASHIHWASYFQYEAYTKLFPQLKEKKHLCGLGKTLQAFNAHNIDITPYLN